MNKSDIRTATLAQRQSLGEELREVYSQRIMALLLDHLAAQPIAPQQVLMYRSLASEVMTDDLLRASAYVCYAPVTRADARMQWLRISSATVWAKGVFGVLEPQSGAQWCVQDGGHDLTAILLCPLTAFDRQGNRLGMGKGCFDAWLGQFGEHIQQVIGLAFSCQEVAQLPVEGHDMPMDYVITEKEVITCTT